MKRPCILRRSSCRHAMEPASKLLHQAKAQALPVNSGWEMLSLEEALASLERTPQLPSVDNFACILHRCRKEKNLAYALRLHAYMCKSGLEAHRFLGNYLVPMWVEVGSMCHAQQVFDRLVARNEHSWTSLISGYTECGESQYALVLYQKMLEDFVHPSGYTFVALLKACAGLKDVGRGQEIHGEIARKRFLERDPFVGSALVDMYAKCGSLANAREAFDKLSVRDAVSWTALITGYVEHGLGQEGLNCFEQMQLEGVLPSPVTFVCSLKACSNIGAIDKGQEIHGEIARKGLERDLVVGNALVGMYAKYGLLAKAQELLDKLPFRDVVTWTALMAGYIDLGMGKEALNCFEQMQLEGVSPNAVTFVCSLKACGSIRATDKGEEMHGEVARQGLLERNPFIGNALIDMYAKCGSLAKAQEAFDKLPVQDVISWTALIASYAEHGLGHEALKCFEQMQLEGVSPNAVTFVCSLKACGTIGAVDKGQEMHAEVAIKGLLENDLVVGSALVDMYAKCGWLAKAHVVFDKLPFRNVVSWTAIMSAHAHLGESENVFHVLERMKGEGVKPDGVTFLCVLSVCSHTGLVDKGQRYFEAMSKDYGVFPTLEHYTCVVDLLGRAGQLDEAVAMMKKMPFCPNFVVWYTVLGACRKWGNVELGRQAFEQAVQLDEKNAASYILMSNIYADAHMQEDEKKVEAMRVNAQAWK